MLEWPCFVGDHPGMNTALTHAAALAASLLLSGAAQASTADAAFAAVSARYLNDFMAITPVEATQLGDHRFDDRIDDLSTAGRERNARLSRQLIDAIDAIDIHQLSRANQVDARLLRHALEYNLWHLETLRDWSWDPLAWTSLAGDSMYLLLARDFAPLPQRMDHLAARLAALPLLMRQERESLVPRRVPAIHATTAAAQNAGLISILDEVIEPQLDQLQPGERGRVQRAMDQARAAILEQQTWIEKTLVPQAHGDFRLGRKLYDEKLAFELDSPLSRREIRRRAEIAIAATRARMYVIARTVLTGRPGAPALPEKPTPDQQQQAIEAALAIAYAQQPARDKVFDAAKAAFAQARDFVRAKDLVTLYPDPLEIIPMPEFQRGVALAYCDAPGPLDTGQKTFYAVAPIPQDWTDAQVHSYLREYNTRAISELTIHEAMPGHYVQLAHANRYHSPLRATLQSGSFIEGWAMYAELMMSEQGYMSGDPLMQLIDLKWYLRATANAIIDQGVHVDGMTRGQLMHLLVHDTFQEESEAAAKWVRAELSSAQLPTYFVGVQEHLALREEARRRWAASFTLKRYNDTVLSFGSPPVRYVRQLMFDLPVQ